MIPAEVNKELFIDFENEDIEVVISPPVIDALIVTGQAPEPHQDTMYFEDWDEHNDILWVRTQNGNIFQINNAKDVTPPPP